MKAAAQTEYRATFREYVEVIYELEEAEIDTIQARIADWLGVSRPSVSEMVHRMEAEGLVTTDGSIRLTDAGRHLAEVVVRRHRLSERFLAEVLKLPWRKVHQEAEVWEQFISDDVEAAMWAALNDPKTCPHGNPIPGAGYVPPKMIALAALPAGETAPLERISEEIELDLEIMDFLDGAGIRPGARLERQAAADEDALMVSVDGRPAVSLEPFTAARLFVAIS
jgi:DtxR family Mn-dependent transcriptional regulator